MGILCIDNNISAGVVPLLFQPPMFVLINTEAYLKHSLFIIYKVHMVLFLLLLNTLMPRYNWLIYCLFCSLISHFYSFILSHTPAFTNHIYALSSCMCSITPMSVEVSSSYSHIRGPDTHTVGHRRRVTAVTRLR